MNPFAVVNILNKSKKTQHAAKTFSPLWDKIFIFEFPNLKASELETIKIEIKVFSKWFDSNMVDFLNEEIGRYEIGETDQT